MEESKTPGRVLIPAEVVLSRDFSLEVKGLYTIMVACVGKDGICRLTESQLSDLAMLSQKTIRKLLGALVRAGLAHLQKRGRYFVVDPVAGYYEALLRDAQRRLARAEFIGEALMREWLTLLVAVMDYHDNARLPKIVNPKTREFLELDRHYPPKVAFEFNGPQHYGPTAKFPDPAAAVDQEVRDLLKEAQCKRHGIELVVVTAQDLTCEGMLRKIGNLLPIRPGAAESPVAAFLEKESRRYRRNWFD